MLSSSKQNEEAPLAFDSGHKPTQEPDFELL